MKKIFINLIIIYQLIKNFFHLLIRSQLGWTHSCQKHPSCSNYMIEQIKKEGFLVGFLKGFARIVTCL